MATLAYRAVRSKRKFRNAPAVKREIENTLDNKTTPELLRKLEAIVANWSSDVSFADRKSFTAESLRVAIFPTGSDKKVWFYVTKGTRPHKIRAKNAPMLSFLWGGPGSYVPKTSPPANYGGPGTIVGGVSVRMKSVNHPGTEARPFPEEIKKEYLPTFSRDMENAFRRGIRKAT